VTRAQGNLLHMALIAALIASLAAGLAGAAVYLTFVEHPARVSCGSALAVTELGPTYKRATVMQAPLALMGASAGIARWATGGGLGWLVSGVVLGAVVPILDQLTEALGDRAGGLRERLDQSPPALLLGEHAEGDELVDHPPP